MFMTGEYSSLSTKRRVIVIGAATIVLLILVATAVRFGLHKNGASGTGVARQTLPQCGAQNDRGFLGTDCQPTRAQVAKYAHIPIGESASHFTSHFVSFQDSHLEATFTIPKSEVAKYLSLVAYPGVKLDQPSAQLHDPKTGEYRQLDLATKGKTVEVRLIVFSA